MSNRPITPNMFMEGAGSSSKLLIRYRLVENRIKLVGEIGAENVQVTSVGSPADEVFDFRVQTSVYDQIFLKSAFDLAERGADVQLEVLVMQALGNLRTLITRLSGSCSPAQPSGLSGSNSLIKVTGRLCKIHKEETEQNLFDAFKKHRVYSARGN